MLTDRGLAAAVEALVVRTPLPVTVDVPPERLPAPIEAAAYYVVAESVTNIVKYAGATAVEVAVETDDDTRHRDASPTTAAAAPTPARGTGLRGLRDRVAALDGTLDGRQPRRTRAPRSSPRSRSRRGRSWRCDAASPLDSARVSVETDTVAFLLCDIEGSTRLVHEAGADYADDPERRRGGSSARRSTRHGGTVDRRARRRALRGLRVARRRRRRRRRQPARR